MSNLDYRELYSRFCRTVNSPVALGAYLRLKYDESQLASLSINPSDYQDVDSFAADYQVVSFLRKWEDLKTGVDKDRVTIQAFLDGERRLFEVNKRLQTMHGLELSHLRYISIMQEKIAKLLGPFSLFKVDDFGWGPGSTATLKGRASTLVHKIREDQMSVTSDALDLAMNVVGSDIHWLRARGISADAPCSLLPSEFNVVGGNRLLTVPKDATKNRLIAAEPSINIFLQKGVGSYIRTRLKMVGIDLNDQTLNQKLAEYAYSKGLATLDLENASNSVSTSVVELLLPPDWYMHLDSLRSKYAVVGERKIKLEMFSSMGNGFTFELESLIFWAATTAVCGSDDVGIYGDDIICPQRYADTVTSLLNSLGFLLNKRKTFVSGCFFESCGKHFFKGVDVTPLYWKTSTEEPGSYEESWQQHRRLNAVQRRMSQISAQYTENVLKVTRWSLHRLWLHAIRRVEVRYVIPDWWELDEGFIVPNYRTHALRIGKYGASKLLVLRPKGRSVFSKKYGWNLALLAYTLRFHPDFSFKKDGVGLKGSPRLIPSKIWFGSDHGR